MYIGWIETFACVIQSVTLTFLFDMRGVCVAVSALNSIFQKWGVSASSTWNTTGDPCSGSAIDDSVTSNDINPALKCLCNFNNGTTCRITQLYVFLSFPLSTCCIHFRHFLSFLSQLVAYTSGISYLVQMIWTIYRLVFLHMRILTVYWPMGWLAQPNSELEMDSTQAGVSVTSRNPGPVASRGAPKMHLIVILLINEPNKNFHKRY